MYLQEFRQDLIWFDPITQGDGQQSSCGKKEVKVTRFIVDWKELSGQGKFSAAHLR
jgi:hypothetical protein